jgi:lipoprotein-anchoring transpeptidase ErfK/SrfK
VSARRPLTGERTVLPVLGSRTGSDGLRWLNVRLPGRPNGRTGWIRERKTTASATRWHVVVHLAARRVIVYERGRPVRAVSAIVGKPSTPTPRGEFFVEEAESVSTQAPGGPFALALSARSGVFQEFEGGPGQIAIHGTDSLSDPLGTAASHGCIRLSPSAITWMSKRIGSGAPVTISS